jgi:hypothetical protein
VSYIEGVSRKSLLLNWVYYPPVGHAVEAFKIAKGFNEANPDMDVHVLLNSQTTVELAQACSWVTRAYPIDLDEVSATRSSAACLRPIPKIWDFIVNDHRPTTSPFPFADSLRIFHDLAETHFSARVWRGGQHEIAKDGGPRYKSNATIRLRIPESANSFLRSLPNAAPKFCIVLGGSSHEAIYPDLSRWIQVIAALSSTWPSARFFVTGKSVSDGRSSTLAFSKDDLATLFGRFENSVDCYDIGLWNQLALLHFCDALIAPHTGFAFLAPCVGTPWVTISGVRWPECFFNDVPFYSVLPECRHYPCWADMKEDCIGRLRSNRSVICMDEELPPRLEDLIEGTRLVLSPEFTFERALEIYDQRIAVMGSVRSRFFQIS